MHCGRFLPHPCSRREFLSRSSGGIGAIALESLWAANSQAKNPQRGLEQFHHAPRAKNIIFLYMDGGVSQIDSFDPKPRLKQEHGKPFPARIEPTQFNNIGTTMACPWKFSQHGESGTWVSELFPHVATCTDKLAVVRNMVSQFSEHNAANYFLHTGFGQAGLPSMGAWISYGLGSASADLPAFIVINGGLIPSGGMDNFSAGFLPALHQGTIFKPQELPIANLKAPAPISNEQRALLGNLDKLVAERFEHDDGIESTIRNYELAFRMQTTVPELADLSAESAHTHRLYGLDADFEPTQIFGRECLLARRMIERGVRFIELTCPLTPGNDRWDAHSNLEKNHRENALATDQPIAGLLKDLDQRGLLEETLVVWSGEFGRTPFAQGSDGRDHNPFGFTSWLAGAGIAGGTVYGQTDEFGYRALGGETTIYDLHATMLHLLGVDHTRLTFRFGGRDMRLTDVHGQIVEPILA